MKSRAAKNLRNARQRQERQRRQQDRKPMLEPSARGRLLDRFTLNVVRRALATADDIDQSDNTEQRR